MTRTCIAFGLILTLAPWPCWAEWKPATQRPDGSASLLTRWAKEVSPENAHPEYPRPQMVRPDWQNLNGLWDYAIRPAAEEKAPGEFDGQILVPFAVESALSGVMKPNPLATSNHLMTPEISMRVPVSSTSSRTVPGRRLVVPGIFDSIPSDAMTLRAAASQAPLEGRFNESANSR